LFPWLGYVTSGAALGIFLAKKNTKKTKFKFLTAMLSISFCLFIFSIIIRELHYKVFDSLNTVNWLTTSETDLHRLSVVILLASVLFAVSIFTVKIPSIILNFGRYSLTIYVVHLVILYGSVISIGINNVYSHQSGIVTSIVAALIMIFAMGVVSLGIDKFKLKRRYKLSHRLKLIFTELI